MPSSSRISRIFCGFIMIMVAGCSHLETVQPTPVYEGRVALKLTTPERIVSSTAQVQMHRRVGVRFLLEDPMGVNTGEIFISSRDIHVDLYADDCVYRLENWSGKLALVTGETVGLEQIIEWILPLDPLSPILTYRIRHSRREALDVSCIPPSDHHYGIVRLTGFHPAFTLRVKWISEPVVDASVALEVPKTGDRSYCDSDDLFRDMLMQ